MSSFSFVLSEGLLRWYERNKESSRIAIGTANKFFVFYISFRWNKRTRIHSSTDLWITQTAFIFKHFIAFENYRNFFDVSRVSFKGKPLCWKIYHLEIHRQRRLSFGQGLHSFCLLNNEWVNEFVFIFWRFLHHYEYPIPGQKKALTGRNSIAVGIAHGKMRRKVFKPWMGGILFLHMRFWIIFSFVLIRKKQRIMSKQLPARFFSKVYFSVKVEKTMICYLRQLFSLNHCFIS